MERTVCIYLLCLLLVAPTLLEACKSASRTGVFMGHNFLCYAYGHALFHSTLNGVCVGGSDDKNKVLLEKVTAITLEQGKMTTGRRVSPIPQVCNV